ncbi:hypothetical protein HZH68_003180 [Vespula germanica]|uniref:Uncharacterized protein n=1 Tax=Vespula germanica TaxID=30212 RepID=A0A834NNT0_VESGE|nr:hypothetical protein HZH68_003180 [Vespula germanica]
MFNIHFSISSFSFFDPYRLISFFSISSFTVCHAQYIPSAPTTLQHRVHIASFGDLSCVPITSCDINVVCASPPPPPPLPSVRRDY